MKKLIFIISIFLIIPTISVAETLSVGPQNVGMGSVAFFAGAGSGGSEYPDPIPTLLIHGYLGNPSNMLPLEEDMIAKGFPANMIARPSMSNAAGLNADLSADVSDAAEELKANLGGQYDSVDIVGYSRGAMNGLDYILIGGAVRNFVGMDGYMPNEPSGDGTPGDTLYYCIDASLGDLATLDGAVNVEEPMSHLSVWNSQAIFDLVQIGLNGNGSNE